ncbi:MAG: DUF2695 domain-containing protein [Halothiobacillus sp.]|jgi:DNA/RNA-binding domain of Phe-tRNA-synthetase-like protein|nr:DUF2695 domain-containing protein [Halothiobacillus sp.]
MPSKSEAERRKNLTREVARREQESAEARMPISKADLAQLFDQLDLAPGAGCDHSLRFTVAFLQAKDLPSDSIIPWLSEHGGFYDCEVLANVEDHWGQP